MLIYCTERETNVAMLLEGIFTINNIIPMVFMVNIPSNSVKKLSSLFSAINQVDELPTAADRVRQNMFAAGIFINHASAINLSALI